MRRLNPEKLYVEFRPGVTITEPIVGRKYTLTHSDMTADLFLTIGLQFAYEKINTMRDEVLAEWRTNNGFPFLFVYVYVDGQFGPTVSAVRNAIFRRELPLALEAVRYGDRRFFDAYPVLDNAPIWINFDSTNSEFNRFENWGTPNDYK
ncbi:staygreen family protein [Pseudobacteroides cellulosolvens]|uniref:Staygreen protein n=1 Tax=Pseudobacteroides cellulosolvens ATCC 35603 = DSM 2933 TaxID=398512 RepID=A0A0L6JKR8_9FIRM|nr:staygreen family protein [Pseudobacteroides cellulosolvens]KNY26384.1 Staygreen protein [Pseudobacteroides cellulosolvens ATCC 35603 = DSM 2933]